MNQAQLADRLELVRWELHPKKHYPLLTLHSLLIDHNPRFQTLKAILAGHNNDPHPPRIKARQQFLDRLFKMLSELVRIPNHENMESYLDQIWGWVNQEQPMDETDLHEQKRVRPTTATTKTRAVSAHSRRQRPPSGVPSNLQQRPTSAYHPPKTQQAQNRPVSAQVAKRVQLEEEMDKTNKKIDYSKLKSGEKEFYTGARTIHSEYEHPKKQLKEYQRKIFYEEVDDEDIEEIELPKPPQQTLPELEIAEEELMPEEEQVQGGEEEENIGDGEQGVNIDDIPIEGEEELGEAEAQEEPKEVIDKLRPKTKSYAPVRHIAQVDPHHYQAGNKEVMLRHHIGDRRGKEDQIMRGMQTKQAQAKGRMKSEMKRRAESARMITKRVGVPVKINKEQEEGTENLVNFENVQPATVNTKGWRPASAFVATNPAKRDALIKKAFRAGRIEDHMPQIDPPGTAQSLAQMNVVGASLAAKADKPKKKTFEEIMREAEERVVREAEDEVMAVKETFARNKISIGANKVMKSITYGGKELEGDDFGGGITGLDMPHNPFFKVAKKKKKKKKK